MHTRCTRSCNERVSALLEFRQNANVSLKMRRTVFETDVVDGGDVVEWVIWKISKRHIKFQVQTDCTNSSRLDR